MPETIGASSIGVAFVRDGAMVDASQPLAVDGPGHQRSIALAADRATLRAGVDRDESRSPTAAIAAGATLAVRLSDRRAAGGASFDDIARHARLDAARRRRTSRRSIRRGTRGSRRRNRRPATSSASIVRAQAAAPDTQIAVAATRVLTWRVERIDRSTFDVTVPRDPGRYVLSVIKMADDGDVGAASIALTVQ